MIEDALDEYPKEGILKDGTRYTIRLLRRRDSQILYDFFRSIPREERLFLPEDVSDKSVIDGWCRFMDIDREVPIVAEVEGRLVGYATLFQAQQRWLRHVGKVTVITHPDYRRRGLALIALNEITNLALHTGHLELLCVECMESQKGNIWMFENAGFIQRGVLIKQARDLDGEDHDLIILARKLRDQEFHGID